MPTSADTFLKNLWPKFNYDDHKPWFDGYNFIECELSLKDKNAISAVLTERKCSCFECGCADVQNFTYGFIFYRGNPLTINAYCSCGNRIARITRASLNRKIPKRMPLPISVDEFLAHAEKNRILNGMEE